VTEPEPDPATRTSRRRLLLGGSALSFVALSVPFGARRRAAAAARQEVAGAPAAGAPTAGAPAAVSAAEAPVAEPVPTDDLTDVRRQLAAARASAQHLTDEQAQAADALAESSAALQSSARRLSQVQTDLADARTQEAAVVQRLDEAKARESGLQASIAAKEAQQATARAALQATTKQIADTQRTLGGLASAAYRQGSLPTLAEVVVGGSSATDVLGTEQALGSASSSGQRQLVRLNQLRAEQARRQAELVALEQRLATDRAAAAQTVRVVGALREQAATQTARTRSLLAAQVKATTAARTARDADLAGQASIDAEQARTGQLLRTLSQREQVAVARAQAAREAARARAAALAAARARAAEQARQVAAARQAAVARQDAARQDAARKDAARKAEVARQAARASQPARRSAPPQLPSTIRRRTPVPTPRPVPRPAPRPVAPPAPAPSGGPLSRPASGPITSGFGVRFHPILHIWRLHPGVDFGIPCGTPVYAAAGGRVVSAAWSGGYGNRVVLDHGDIEGIPLGTTYNHLTRPVVRVGARVQRGQLVGISGTTGLSTGCHLHFEVYENGHVVDPMHWL